MQGRPAPQSGAIFHDFAKLPITNEEFYAENAALQREWFPKTKPLPGVLDLLEGLKKKGVHMALATSSHSGNFKLKSGHLGNVFDYFPEGLRILGDDKRIKPGRGKPAPDIYLLALEVLNAELRAKGEKEVKPEECLVFEDSVPGVESGRRAGMQVVWCPHPGLLEEYRGREGEVLAGLTGEHIEEEEQGIQGKAPGMVDDGWGKLLETLEGFPYETFGIKEGAKQ